MTAPQSTRVTSARHGSTIALLCTAIFAGACAVHSVDTTLSREHIGTKYARISGYFATRGAAPGGSHKEGTPGNIRHDVVLDEAKLVTASAAESCFDVVVRMDSTYDEPIEQLQPSCSTGGDAVRAVVENEMVSVYDYSYTGTRNVVDIEGVAASEFFGMSVAQPAEKVFRVIERQGRVCCPVGGNKIALDLTHPDWNVADYAYHLVFKWTIR